MTTFTSQLVARAWKSHRPHAIVMSIVIAVALAPATTVPGPAPSGASPEELITIPAPAVDGRMPPQSLGYLEFDWADGGVPGFARLSDNSNQYASKQRENAQP